jgi:predicted AAA+ superfamily ATPase
VLRAALEGDVAARPANVLVWATSNRMRLVRETRSEREDELEVDLARGEKSALATRFGRRVRFDAPDQDDYLRIVERLVGEALGAVPPGTAEAALRFARAGHGATPRTARQFVAGLHGRA